MPFGVAIVVTAIIRFAGGRGGSAAWPARIAAPLAIALGPAIALVFGTLVLKKSGLQFSLHPLEPFDWYLFAPLAALLVGVAAVWVPAQFAALIVASAGAILALCLAVRPGMTVIWELWPAVALPAVLVGFLEPLARRNQNLVTPILMLLLAGSATVVNLDSSSINLGIACISLPAAIFGLLVSYPLLVDRDLSRAGLPAFVLLWAAMLIYGYFWADVPWLRIVLIAGAPLAAYVAEFPPIRSLRPFWRAIVRVALVAIPLAFAVVPAARDLQKQMHEQMQQQDF